MREMLSRRYAELVYMGMWFHDLRQSLQMFFTQTQRYVTGEVRLKLYKGSCRVLGRRSPHSLYDGQLANQTNLEWFEGRWSELAQGFTTLWTLPSRLAARQQTTEPQSPWRTRLSFPSSSLYKLDLDSQDNAYLTNGICRPGLGNGRQQLGQRPGCVC